MSGLPFTRAFSSDLVRASETAEIIAEPQRVPVITDIRLREFDFGEWEGRTWAEIVERWPELKDRSYTAARSYEPAGGESFADVVRRAGSFLNDLRRFDDDRILVVTHAGVLHAFLAALGPALQGPDPLSVSFSTASVTRVAMEGSTARLITVSDDAHLDPSR